VYASLYSDRLSGALNGRAPAALVHGARSSVGAALGAAQRIEATGHAALGGLLHAAATRAFIHGLSGGCLVACGVALAGAVMAAALLPAQPLQLAEQTEAPRSESSLALVSGGE
jgi:hypothetical protein